MATDKPLISILMAVYEPRMDWLKEQLDSLNAQTYPNIRLYVRDDCSPTVPFEKIEAMVRGCVTTFPYSVKRNEHNLGSNGTFELLTREAEGEYFAYCDQDDVWLPEKLAVLRETIERERAQLVCSDMYIIDGNGKQIADSITKVRHRHVFYSGDVFHHLLTRNFVTGCTMLTRTKTAQNALPFMTEMVHDHWIALYAAANGSVFSVPDRLIRYRIHGGNQTGVLKGISNKKEYVDVRIRLFRQRVSKIIQRIPNSQKMEETLRWADARERFADGEAGARLDLWRCRSENIGTTLFEILTLRLPDPLFCFALHVARRCA